MATIRSASTVRLLGRSLMPSLTSGVLCLGFGIVMAALRALSMNANLGAGLPGGKDVQWALAYDTYIVRPLKAFIGGSGFNDVALIILWGLIGLGVFLLGSISLHFYQEYRAAQHNVQLAGQQIVQHPGRREFIVRLGWRAAVIVLAAISIGALQPLLGWVLQTNSVATAGALTNVAGHIALQAVGWAIIVHVCIVLLRLFLMRTRVFGERMR